MEPALRYQAPVVSGEPRFCDRVGCYLGESKQTPCDHASAFRTAFWALVAPRGNPFPPWAAVIKTDPIAGQDWLPIKPT